MRHFTIISRFTIVCLSLCLMIQTWAGPIDKQQARQQAVRFMQNRGVTLHAEPKRAPGRNASADNQPVYIFNTENHQGFVIVAGDDRAETILGYTEHGSYDETELPDNFRVWLEATAAEIEALGERSDAKAPQKVPNHAPIAPMIQSKWNQGTPYNALCPIINGEHCWTGCVPTAGAQVMYYYQWPQQPTKALPGYGSDNGTSSSLASTTFKWDKMKNTYSYDDEGTESGQAVSELMLYCGYAARVSYGLEGSGASIWTLANGMVEYFDYDPNTMRFAERNNYSIADWDKLIYKELAEGRPVIYTGYPHSDQPGHAFICEGYDGDGFFFFNFGWGGYCDGHYKLHATLEYITGQAAIIGLQPNIGIETDNPYTNDEWEEETVEGITATVRSLEVTDDDFRFDFINYNETTETFGIGLGELLPDGSISVVNTKSYTIKLDTYHYIIPSFSLLQLGLSVGTHIIVPICKREGETEWKRCNPLRFYIVVTIGNDGSMNVVVHPTTNLSVSNFTVISANHISADNKLKDRLGVSYDVTNENEEDNYEGILSLWLDDTRLLNSELFKIKCGNTRKSDSYYYVDSLEEGQHTIRLCTDYDQNVLAVKTFTYQRSNLTATAFDFPDCRLKGVVQRVNITVENSGGEYVGPLYLFASQTDDLGESVSYSGFAIEQNGSEEVELNFTPNKEGLWNIWVCKDKEGTGIIGQGTVNISSLKATFDVVSNRHFNQSQQVDISIQNPGGEYHSEFVFWVSKTDNLENATYLDSHGITLPETSVTTQSFRFYPDDTGEWFMWLTDKWDKEAIIGHAMVDIGTLKATDIALTGNGHVNNTQDVAVTIENPKGKYQGFICLFASKTDNWESYSWWDSKEISISAQSDSIVTLQFYPNEEGEWHLWAATGWNEKDIIGHTMVNIGTLKATDLEVTGTMYTNWEQQIDVTIENPMGDYDGYIYIFASKTDDFATYSWSNGKKVSISAQSESTVSLPFTPDSSGEWHIWVTTDWEKDIIGHTSVNIKDAPEGEIQLTLLDKAIQIEGTTATMTLQLKNTGELTSYKGLCTYLYEVTPDEYIFLRTYDTPLEIIEQGETKELNIVYDDLEKDKTYCIYIYYYSSLVSPWERSYLDYIDFNMSETPTGIRGVTSDNDNEGWYTLDGLKLDRKPSKRGVYIHKGRKVMLNIR